jgi:carboxyl-terminal processing protease
MAMGLGGWLVTEPDRKLGTLIARDGKLSFALNPRDPAYTGPVVVLVDGLSGSTSEILAGGLKDLKRARVIGTRTMGAALPSMFVRLPNGDGFQYAFANYISSGGQPLEGRGVEPDEIVAPERKALLEGRDPAVDAAVRWIRSQHKGK